MADRLFQHYPRALGQPDGGQVGADAAIHRGGRGEVGDQLILRADMLEQRRVVLGLEKIHAQVAQTCEEARQVGFRQFLGWHVQAQRLFDGAQVVTRLARFAGQSEDARGIVQQTGTIELVKRRKQLTQGQIAQRAEQGKGAGFKLHRRHEFVLLSR